MFRIILKCRDHISHDGSHAFFGFGCFIKNRLVGCVSDLSFNTEVGYDADGKNRQIHVTCNDDLRRRRRTNDPEVFVLSRSFKGGAACRKINPFMDSYLMILCNDQSFFDEVFIIRLSHIRETGTYPVVVLSDKRIGKKVDMISDYHNVADPEGRVHPSCGIREEKAFNSEVFKYSDWKCNLFRTISFVVMEPPLHCNDFLPAKVTKNKLSGMSLNC